MDCQWSRCVENVESSQTDGVAPDEVMGTLGIDQNTSNQDSDVSPEDDLPVYAKEKIGKLQKRHQKEKRDMRNQIDDLAYQVQSLHERFQAPAQSSMSDDGQPSGNNVEEHIQRAVNSALRAKDEQERKGREAEQLAHVHKQFKTFSDHLDNASDTYDDFDEVVRGKDAPFTPAMLSSAMSLPPDSHRMDMLYKLGKDRDELKRLSTLTPIEQSQEMVRLYLALASGEGGKNTTAPKAMSQIKNSAIQPQNITDKTSVSELRRRMKAGWK